MYKCLCDTVTWGGFEQTPRIVSYGKSIASVLRTLYTDFHTCWTNWHSHQQCIESAFWPHPHQHLLLFIFVAIAILTGVGWNLSVILICIFLWWLLCWTVLLNIFHGFVGHLYFLFWGWSVHFINPSTDWVVCFLSLVSWFFLYPRSPVRCITCEGCKLSLHLTVLVIF